MIREKIRTDSIQALKARDDFKVSCLRFILSQITNKEIDKKAALTDQETIEVLRKAVKELKESILAFEKGGRADLTEKSKRELAIVSSYLPAEISDEELQKEIKTIIEKNQGLYQKNPKAIIGLCVRELKEKADPGRIVKILSEIQP